MTAPDDTVLLLNAYRDGELSPGEALAMERRLASDPSLRALSDRLETLSGLTREALATPPPSPMLRARVVEQLGFADAAPRRGLPRHWQSLAAALMVGLIGGGVIGSGGTYFGLVPGMASTTDAVLAGHLRGLIAEQPYDVASSNRHVVKPWFNGRTTIAPETPDFADRGFPLAGGRIDIVNGKPVPTLVYRRDKHVISVTITPRTTSAPEGEDRRGGSSVVHWTVGDLTYWAVSDLDVRELRTFAALFSAQTGREG